MGDGDGRRMKASGARNEAREAAYLVTLCGAVMALAGWLMFGAASDARTMSVPGALLFAAGWACLAWGLSDGGRDRGVAYAAALVAPAMLGLAAPMLSTRGTALFAVSWSLFIAATSWVTYTLARDVPQRARAVEAVVVMALVTLGVVVQFTERRLNIAWVFSGEPNVAHSVFSFGTAMLAVGLAALPAIARDRAARR